MGQWWSSGVRLQTASSLYTSLVVLVKEGTGRERGGGRIGGVGVGGGVEGMRTRQ